MKGAAGRASGAAAVGLAAAVAAASAPGFLGQHRPEPIRPGPGVTAVRLLSAYHGGLADGPGDTPVYELAGPGSGGTALILGGTHADEPAGHLASVVVVERGQALAGRLLVIPRANASGFTHTVPLEGHPPRISIPTPRGEERVFQIGGRATNPVHQWPDPAVYVQPASGQRLSGLDTRNLNRAYPGRPDGSLTEQVAFAIMRVLVEEEVDLAFDLHEAAPEYPIVNAVVAHDRAAELAALVSMEFDAAGLSLSLEGSPQRLRGLSHREWGDGTGALAVLFETANPAQGRLRGRTDEEQVTSGRDRYYALAARRGRLTTAFPAGGYPIEVRVARHIAAIRYSLEAYSLLAAERGFDVEGLPSYLELTSAGLGAFLN